LPAQSPEIARKQAWFQQPRFRQAISLAIDREAINRIVYRGRGTPLWGPVTPANSFWSNAAIPHPARSLENARKVLAAAGFSWRDGVLVDSRGSRVDFSIVTSASNNQRTQMATMVQGDLKDLGIAVQVVPLEFRGMLDRIFQTHDYEAAVLALGGGDVDPNSQMNTWLSSGKDHLWNIGRDRAATAWEAEIDQLMQKQLSTLNRADRKKIYDRVQIILAENLPLICLVSPNILVGAKTGISNFQPAILDPHTLWNSQDLFFSPKGPGQVQ
jgi:peptide/nickel transport system substrate-binding protein